jgi:two-component sensor histidine kinase
VVTELVINALKHAFPRDRHGTVAVGYSATSGGWVLSVADNGIGMPSDDAGAQAGLGTSIVQALAKQLDARINVSDSSPGTLVTLTHNVLKPGEIAADHPAV